MGALKGALLKWQSNLTGIKTLAKANGSQLQFDLQFFPHP
jgi:hypothetical protein